MRQRLLGMQKEYLIELEDAVVAVKDRQGRVKLSQLINPTAMGAPVAALVYGSAARARSEATEQKPLGKLARADRVGSFR